MRQPRIRKGLVRKLRRVACAYEMPMTTMLNHVLTVALDELDGEQDDYTICIPVRSAAPPHQEVMPQASAHADLLAGLLGDCLFALDALLTSPDLTLDGLAQAIRDAIEVAHETLGAVHTALDAHEGKA